MSPTAERTAVDVRGRLTDASVDQQPLLAASLPADILLLIFNLDYQDDMSPLIFSWVCRHWREVATEYPLLWTIFPHKRALLRLFFERSKRMPVSLSLGHSRPCDFTWSREAILPADGVTAELITPHMDRVASLKIRECSNDPDHDVIRSWMRYLVERGPLNALKSLEVGLYDADGDSEECFAVSEEDARAYGQIAPSLRNLATEGVFIPPCDLYNDLTRLAIGRACMTEIPLHALLRLLGRSPNLASLTLDCLEFTELEDTPRELPGLPPFPRLADFSFDEILLPEVTALFRRLVLPSGIAHFSYNALDIMLGPQNFRMPAQKFAAAVAVAHVQFYGAGGGHARRHDTKGCGAIVCRRRPDQDGPHVCERGKRRVVQLELPEAPQVASLAGLVRWLSPNVESAELLEIKAVASRVRSSIWRAKILAPMPGLKKIRVHGCYLATIPLFEALAVDGEALPLCPELRTVEVTKFLSSRVPGAEDELDDDAYESDSSDEESDVDMDSDIEMDDVEQYGGAGHPGQSGGPSQLGGGGGLIEAGGPIEGLPEDAALAEYFWKALETMVATRYARNMPLESVSVSDVPPPLDTNAPGRIRAMVVNAFGVSYAI